MRHQGGCASTAKAFDQTWRLDSVVSKLVSAVVHVFGHLDSRLDVPRVIFVMHLVAHDSVREANTPVVRQQKSWSSAALMNEKRLLDSLAKPLAPEPTGRVHHRAESSARHSHAVIATCNDALKVDAQVVCQIHWWRAPPKRARHSTSSSPRTTMVPAVTCRSRVNTERAQSRREAQLGRERSALCFMFHYRTVCHVGPLPHWSETHRHCGQLSGQRPLKNF